MANTRLYVVTLADKSELFIESTSQAQAMNYAARRTLKIRIPKSLEVAKAVQGGAQIHVAVAQHMDIEDET